MLKIQIGSGRRLALVSVLLQIVTFVNNAQAESTHKPEIVPQLPHSAYVNAVAFSPDGTMVLSGSRDSTLKLWHVDTGLLLRTFESGNDVRSIAFSPDSSRVLSGGADNNLKLFDAATGQLLLAFDGHSAVVETVAFSADGRRVISGSDDTTVRLWDAETGRLLRTFKDSDRIYSAAISPDDSLILSGGWNSKILKLRNAVTGDLVRTFPGFLGVFSTDGTRILSAEGHKLYLSNVATGQILQTFEGASSVSSMAFSPNGIHVLSGCGDNSLRLWNIVTGSLLGTFEGHVAAVNSVAFSPDGTRVLSGSGAYDSAPDNWVRLWDVANGNLLRSFGGRSDSVHSVVFSPDGAAMLSASGTTLKLWNTATGQLLRTFKGHSGTVFSAAFSSDGAHVLSGSGDETVKLWDVKSGQLMRTYTGHFNEIHSVAFSADDKRILAAGSMPMGRWSKTIEMWETATGRLLQSFQGHSEPVNSVAFSPDGAQVLSGSGGSEQRTPTNDNTVRLWNATTGALTRTFEGHSHWVLSVAFSPDGTRVLSGSYDKTLKLWDVTTGELIRTFEGHSGPIWSIAFSPDGDRVLSGSSGFFGGDNVLRLWDVTTGKLLRTFAGHLDGIRSVAFSRDGRIASASSDTTVKIWDPTTGDPIVSLMATRDDAWLALTPAGFFSRSGNGSTEILSLVRGLDLTTIEQVHQSLFNPDLVREALADDPRGEVRDAAKVINLDKVLASGPAPSVAITSPMAGSQSGTDLVAVRAKIIDRGKGIGRIEWRVNGVTIAVADKLSHGGSSPDHTVSQALALDPGENIVEVVAYNGSNLLASLAARTTITFTGSAGSVKPNLHIFAIGINAYTDKGWVPPGSTGAISFPPLALAVKDAITFSADMQKAAGTLYGAVRVTMALDRAATRAALEKIIDKLSVDIHLRDTFMLFVAAHGASENGRFYIIPADYQGGPGALARGAIGQDRLQDWLANRIKARKALILLDTCESGALVAGHARSRTDTPASEAAVGRLHEATGRPVLTAAASGKPALEGLIAGAGQRHGVFTWALLDALRNGDANGDGTIELSEFVAHVQTKVPALSAELGGTGEQLLARPHRISSYSLHVSVRAAKILCSLDA